MSRETYGEELFFASLRRQVRLVTILDAAEKSGLTPLPILQLHTLAFLANTLAPVWDFEPVDGKVLKRRGGPFYPRLQTDLDLLVGQGIALISNINYIKDEKGKWRLDGKYRLNRKFADRIMDGIREFSEEHRLIRFIEELTMAFSLLPEENIDGAMEQDAIYGDKNVDIDNVIDFDEWKKENFTLNVTKAFEEIAQKQSSKLLPGEKIQLYVDHLARRLHADG